MGFLPPEDPRVAGTVAAVERELLANGFVVRYRTDEVDDGIGCGEGAFLACSFWLADAYVMLGRIDDATALFERLLAVRNDLGLLAEQYAAAQGRLVGNFPQGFSHVGLINTAYNLIDAHGPARQRSERVAPAAEYTRRCFRLRRVLREAIRNRGSWGPPAVHPERAREEVYRGPDFRGRTARRRVDRKYPVEFNRVVLELQWNKKTLPDLANNQKFRLIDYPLAGDCRGHERIAVVGAQRAFDGNARLALRPEGPPISADRLRQGITEVVMTGEIGDGLRLAPPF